MTMLSDRLGSATPQDPAMTLTMRPTIRASWERSIESGLDRQRLVVSFEQYDDEDALVRAAQMVFRTTTEALIDTTTWIAIANPHGVVTHEWASKSIFTSGAPSVASPQGIVLREDAVGTNGIGLALATKEVSSVSGMEHFNPDWSTLSCVAGPVINPSTRELLGVINVTCLAEEKEPYLRIVLQSLVSGVQHALSQGARSRQQRLLDAHTRVKNIVRAPTITLDDRTMIVEDEVSSIHLDRALLWELVNSAGPHATLLELPTGQRLRMIVVEAGTLASGCSLVFSQAWPTSEEISDQRLVKRDKLSPIEQAEYDIITATLRDCGGNKSLSAAKLQIARGTLYERLRRYDIPA